MKTLWWKEWRETRAIFLVGVLVLLGLTFWALGSTEWFKLYSSRIDPSFTELLSVPLFLFGVLLGAGAMSRETGNETAPFLLAMPVRRQKIWFVKFAVRLLELYLLFALFCFLDRILRNAIAYYNTHYDYAHFELFILSLATLSYVLTFLSSCFFDKAMTSALRDCSKESGIFVDI